MQASSHGGRHAVLGAEQFELPLRHGLAVGPATAAAGAVRRHLERAGPLLPLLRHAAPPHGPSLRHPLGHRRHPTPTPTATHLPLILSYSSRLSSDVRSGGVRCLNKGVDIEKVRGGDCR